MQFYDVLMKFDRKIIGFKLKITGTNEQFYWDERKSINVVFACDCVNPHKSESL